MEFGSQNENVTGKNQAQEVSVGKTDSIDSWTPDHVCSSLVENFSIFYSCLDTSQAVEIKDNELICG